MSTVLRAQSLVVAVILVVPIIISGPGLGQAGKPDTGSHPPPTPLPPYPFPASQPSLPVTPHRWPFPQLPIHSPSPALAGMFLMTSSPSPAFQEWPGRSWGGEGRVMMEGAISQVEVPGS